MNRSELEALGYREVAPGRWEKRPTPVASAKPKPARNGPVWLSDDWERSTTDTLEDGRRRYVFYLPLPPSRNYESDGHWSRRYKKAEEYWEMLDLMVMKGIIPPPPPKPLTRVQFFLTFRTRATRFDTDNATARWKFAGDWLVNRGYIKDDSDECLVWAHPVRRERAGETVGFTYMRATLVEDPEP